MRTANFEFRRRRRGLPWKRLDRPLRQGRRAIIARWHEGAVVHRPNGFAALRAVVDPYLPENSFDVNFDGGLTDVDLAGNDFIRVAVDQATQDKSLPARQTWNSVVKGLRQCLACRLYVIARGCG